MDLREFLVTDPALTQELCSQLSFEDAIQLQVLLKLEQKINCIFQLVDNQNRIYTLRGVNPDTIRAYRLIKNNEHISSFFTAALIGNINTLRLLLEIGVNIDMTDQYGATVLIYASQRRQPEMVKFLLERGADPNISDREGYTALMYAVQTYSLEVAKILLDNPKTDVNLVNNLVNNALMLAPNQSTTYAKLLLEKGIDINAVNKNGNTVLMNSSRYASIEFVKFLLEHGADPNIVDSDGTTALIDAVFEGRPEIVKLLLENPQNKANPNIVSRNSGFALLTAVQFGRTKIVELLLENGANPNLTDRDGNTLLKIASRMRYQEIVELLKSHGAI